MNKYKVWIFPRIGGYDSMDEVRFDINSSF